MQADASAPAAAPAPQVYLYDDASGAPAPDWAREMIDDLRASGIPGIGDALPGKPETADSPSQIIDLTV